jgi:hypothetical protein
MTATGTFGVSPHRDDKMRLWPGYAPRLRGTLAEDPATRPPVASHDPDDDYLLALAISRRAYLVTGDQDLLVLSDNLPILRTSQFVSKLRQSR